MSLGLYFLNLEGICHLLVYAIVAIVVLFHLSELSKFVVQLQ